MKLDYIIAPVKNDDSYSIEAFITIESLTKKDIKCIMKNKDYEKFELRLRDINDISSAMIKTGDFLHVLCDNKKMCKTYFNHIKVIDNYHSLLSTYTQMMRLFVAIYKAKKMDVMKEIANKGGMYEGIYDKLWHCDSYTNDELVQIISKEMVDIIIIG